MEKIKIVSLSKSDFRSEYVFRKEQIFFEFVRKFLVDLGFEDYEFKSLGRPYSESEGDYLVDKEEDIKNYVDRMDTFGNEKYFVDIIYFSQKIHLIINSREDKQQEIVKILDKYIDWGQD